MSAILSENEPKSDGVSYFPKSCFAGVSAEVEAEGEMIKTITLRWRKEGPDSPGYWLRYDGSLYADYVTAKDLLVLKESPLYLGRGIWCGPIASPRLPNPKK